LEEKRLIGRQYAGPEKCQFHRFTGRLAPIRICSAAGNSDLSSLGDSSADVDPTPPPRTLDLAVPLIERSSEQATVEPTFA
jgi:hypothetical protein